MTSASSPSDSHPTAGVGLLRRAAQPTVILNVVAPVVAYQYLTGRGASQFSALAAGSIFPLLAIAVSAVRSRRLEWFGILSLATSVAAIVIGSIGSILLGTAHFMLIKDPVITGVIGLIFLGSLAFGRPLVFLFSRQMADSDGARVALDQLWTTPAFRRRARRMTAIWGLALIGEAGLRIGLSFVVPPATQLLISPMIAAAVFGPLAAWSLRRRAALMRTTASGGPANATSPLTASAVTTSTGA